MAASLLDRIGRRLAGMIDRVQTSEPVVALTFDDGPDPASTPAVLDLLRRHHARATFFCVGERAAAHPELTRRMAEDGHVIGNHSWSHERFPLMTAAQRVEQLARAAAHLPRQPVRLFRPPYGDYSLGSAFDVWRKGYQAIAWDVLVRDWCERDAGRMRAVLEEKVRPGSIVLLHDALYKFTADDYPPRDAMLGALDDWLDHNGTRYRFVTVPELLAASRRYVRRSIRRIPPAQGARA